MSEDTFLKVRDLKIGATAYPPGEPPKWIEIVHGISFDLEKGKVLGLIGESGAGKSTIGLAAMGYGRGGVEISGGEVWINDRDILATGRRDLRRLRGGEVTYVSQSAAASFNPAKKLMEQVIEASVRHGKFSKSEAEQRATTLLEKLSLPYVETIGERYTHHGAG